MPEMLDPRSGSWSDDEDIASLLESSRPSWHADAACKEAPDDITWFPERGQPSGPAKKVCGRCLVVEECLAWSLEQDSKLDGIWGGLSRSDRVVLRRQRAA